MREVTVQEQILDLLLWIKEEGYWPKRFRGAELFVIPMSGKMGRWRDLKEHQRGSALWVPSIPTMRRVLKQRGVYLAHRGQDGVHFTGFFRGDASYRGAGVGKAEAILSAFQAMRRRCL